MYAVIETGGKQYRVNEGDVIFVEKLENGAEEKVVFEKVILIGDDKKSKIGSPYVKGATVDGVILKSGKAKKITVFTYKSKKNEKRKLGHRQPYSQVRIDAISLAK